MKRVVLKGYGVQSLNNTSPTSWAVIEEPSGKIATDSRTGALLMRLTKADAIALAAAMTTALQQSVDFISPFLGG